LNPGKIRVMGLEDPTDRESESQTDQRFAGIGGNAQIRRQDRIRI
jgi:hypothetical protein